MYQPVQTLPEGALDIVGDVHGEWQALLYLLKHLGYDEAGNHPQNRKLVFVGDLCDRGPNSPAVLAWFKCAHDAGNAWMVLGNHELNAIIGDAKDGSGWFFPERTAKDSRFYAPWQMLPEGEHRPLIAWLSQMPIILQRSDLRIVHAAWINESVTALQQGIRADGVAESYRRWDEALHREAGRCDWYADYLHEQQVYAQALENPHEAPPPMPATARFELRRSLQHPIRTLTSGAERELETPFFAGNRWRFSGRDAWWNRYTDDVAVVVGHYWRSWDGQEVVSSREDLFPEAGNRWLGAKHNVFCIDFSVGARWRDRSAEPPVAPQHSRHRLAALRWPEKTLVFDNGEVAATAGYGGKDGCAE